MGRKQNGTIADLGLLTLRLTTGGLMMGHGAQKLWGMFGGYGIEGTAGWLESLGLKPGRMWAQVAGGSEFSSGLLTAVGLLGPLGPLSMFGPMVTAWVTAHAGKPIWVTSGGAELPLTNIAIAVALATAGPGRYSLDEILDIELPTPVVALGVAAIAAGIGGSLLMRDVTPPDQNEARDQLQSGADSVMDEVDTATA